MTDHELVYAFKHGDELAFDKLFERHKNTIKFWCYQQVPNNEDSEDIAQTVWLELYLYIKNFNQDCSFRTLASRIVKNRSLDWIRNNRNPEISMDYNDLIKIPIPSKDMPDYDIMQKEMVEDILSLLDPEERPLIVGKIKGYTDEELADSIGVSVMALKSRLFRARQKLKEVYTLSGERK